MQIAVNVVRSGLRVARSAAIHAKSDLYPEFYNY